MEKEERGIIKGEDPRTEVSSPDRRDNNHEETKTKNKKTKCFAPLAKRLCTRPLIEFRRVRLPCGADIADTTQYASVA